MHCRVLSLYVALDLQKEAETSTIASIGCNYIYFSILLAPYNPDLFFYLCSWFLVMVITDDS